MNTQKKLTKEQWRKKKELDEARKAGTVEAEKDESGKDINPHIPLYITRAPWYLNKNEPTLSHQRPQNSSESSALGLTQPIQKGTLDMPAPTKYRKGACENCGAMTHKKKDCVERPRRRGAHLTHEDIQPDELLVPHETTYDGKRDRWNNYDPSEHLEVIKDYDLLDKVRLQNTLEKNQEKDEYRVDEEEEGMIQKLDTKTRTTVRHLRIREDTAKYLYNLDPNSAFYDPKTRSMRENPNLHKKPEEQLYSGDNFTRITGDAKKFNEFRAFAWDAYEKGVDIHNVAAPSSAEIIFKETKNKTSETIEHKKRQLLDRYGGEEHLQNPPKELIFGQQEVYVEYSRDGNLIKGSEKQVPKSKYEEDVFLNNHKAVWGSYWHAGSWGYACCHQMIKNCYCTGEKGREIAKSLTQPQVVVPSREVSEVPEGGGEGRGERERRGEERGSSSSSSSSSSEEDSGEKRKRRKEKKKKEKKEKKRKREKEKKREKKEKMRLALEKLERMEKQQQSGVDERKKGYNSLSGDYRVTDEEMEIYQMKKRRFEDPMKDFLN